MRIRYASTCIGLFLGLALAGCTGLTTVGQAISSAMPNAVAPTVTLVCANALCAHATQPHSAQKNSNGAYEVLPARPFVYVEATYPDLLALTVTVNNTNLQLLSSGSLDECHPAGCAFYQTLSIQPTPPSTQPTHMTLAKINIIPPDALAHEQQLLISVGTRNSTQSASHEFYVAAEIPGTPTNAFAGYSPNAKGVGGIFVGWTAPHNSFVDHYVVTRNDGHSETFFGDPAHEEYADTSVAHSPGTWSYQVQAVNASGESAKSNSATATVPQSPGSSGNGAKTCDNKTPAANAANYTFAVENPSTKCLTNVVTVFANSQSDAQNCIKAAAVPNAVIGLASQASQHFFALYQADGNNGYYCETVNEPGLSANDAKTCTASVICSNCTVNDITGQVVSNGQLSASYNTWCSDHPNP